MGKRAKNLGIGLRQARRLCQLPEPDRLAFISEGLPIILNSAEGFWDASRQLDAHSREAEVLEGFAAEEAAKILILMDAVRCPPKLLPSKLNKIIGWFYDHLARLIYADAIKWKPADLAELRRYIDQDRRGHYIEGFAGEYIMPNWTVYQRESSLYADVESNQDGSLKWNSPRRLHAETEAFASSLHAQAPTLRLARAMQQLGLFTPNGLKATSEIWGSLEFCNQENRGDVERLTQQLLARLEMEGLILGTAKDEDATALYETWQMPMYNLELSMIPVTLEELEAEQDAALRSEIGDPW